MSQPYPRDEDPVGTLSAELDEASSKINAVADLAAEWRDFEWQEPCANEVERAHARGFENAMRLAASDLDGILEQESYRGQILASPTTEHVCPHGELPSDPCQECYFDANADFATPTTPDATPEGDRA